MLSTDVNYWYWHIYIQRFLQCYRGSYMMTVSGQLVSPAATTSTVRGKEVPVRPKSSYSISSDIHLSASLWCCPSLWMLWESPDKKVSSVRYYKYSVHWSRYVEHDAVLPCTPNPRTIQTFIFFINYPINLPPSTNIFILYSNEINHHSIPIDKRLAKPTSPLISS